VSECEDRNCRPEIGCELGEELFQNCPNWRAASKKTDHSESDTNHEGTLDSEFPWSGNALGAEAVSFVAGRSNPTIVAVIGPYNSGKTTLLASWYLLTTRGQFPKGQLFSGSYTLGAWENISHRLRWSEDAGPTFPAHTPVGGRRAGMLHLSYRSRSNGILKDFLFVDAPGEWYRAWSIAEDAPNAEGARWIAANADMFIVLSDSESLAGKEPGETRQTLQNILDRLGSTLDGRPLALIWSKADIQLSGEIKKAIRDAARLASACFDEFEVSVYPENDKQLVSRRFLKLLDWATHRNLAQVGPPRHALQTTDALGPYGRSLWRA
jgi:double-GTPase-like protein